jgi:DNA repair protein RadC
MNNYLSIKDWAVDEKPREKLSSKGRESLSNTELLAILIGTGTRHKSAVDLAREILKLANNNLNLLARLTIKDLCTLDGVGPAKAITVIAAIELGSRKKQSLITKDQIISSSSDAYAYYGPLLEDKSYEEFWVMLLGRNNKIIKSVKLSEGGIEATVVDAKKLFKSALQHNASSLILCHNHPSGNLTPSGADIRLTKKLKLAAENLDISIIDHLIIGQGGFYSFADEGNL